MENRVKRQKHVLLPRYFKKIGLVTIGLAFVPLIIFRLMGLQSLHAHKDLIKVLLLDFLIVGLSLIAWSEDKLEDEMTVTLRLKSIAQVFGLAVFYVLIDPIFNFFKGHGIDFISGQQLIILMLLLYLMTYYSQKNSR
jgi:hypothetical protein